jgi:hypothetical protein
MTVVSGMANGLKKSAATQFCVQTRAGIGISGTVHLLGRPIRIFRLVFLLLAVTRMLCCSGLCAVGIILVSLYDLPVCVSIRAISTLRRSTRSSRAARGFFLHFASALSTLGFFCGGVFFTHRRHHVNRF